MSEDNKFITRATRDKNIRTFEKKKGKIKKPLTKKPESKITREDIEKAVRPIRTGKVKKAKEKPWLIMKEQEKLKLTTDTEISMMLESSYEKERKFGEGLKEKKDWKRTSLAFGHCTRCHRSCYYDFFEHHKARAYSTGGLILFDEGKRHHKNIQNRLDDMGMIKNSEGYLFLEEINAQGYYDGLIPIGAIDGWTICDILEIKSKGVGGMSCSQIDYDQAQLYLHASKLSMGLKASKIKTRNIRILYKDRSGLAEKIHYGWMALPDLERQNDIMDYMRFLWNVVYGQKKLFPHPYERKSKKCKYCRYHAHCWKGFSSPDDAEEADVSKIMEVETPTAEIVNSFANRLFKILKDERDLREEKKTLIPALLKYFIETQTKLMHMEGDEGLGVSQSKLTRWDVAGLKKAVGIEIFSKISKPDGGLVTALINEEYLDAGKFQEFKKYKLSEPSIQIRKVKKDD